MNNKKELTTQEIMHIVTDKLFATREKWGDEIFISYSGHVDGIGINIHSGKWLENKECISITIDKYMTFDEALYDLNKYHELGFKYFINNDRYYWYKSDGFKRQFGDGE